MSASWDGKLRLWDARRGKVASVPVDHGRNASTAVLSPDGRWVASGGSSNVVKIWEVREFV